MDRSNLASVNNPSHAATGGIHPEVLNHQMPALAWSPAGIIRHRTAQWHGLQVRAVQFISHEPYEYRFKEQCHLLVAVEQGVRYDGETFLEGLPKSTVRDYSHKLVFVPAGRSFLGSQRPRLLTRGICVYIDPDAVPVDPGLRFAESYLEPRLLFDDSGLWETVLKLKAQIGSTDPVDRIYAEALGGLLAHELVRLQRGIPVSTPASRGGLAGWQQRRVIDFMEEHIAEQICLNELANLTGLSPYHFLRCFKQSFGEPPHRYWTRRRIERAKALLADPHASVTDIGLDVGFGSTSAFSAAFHRLTGKTPREYRRNFE
jgi:AraC family transcriptional regulator